jgi:RNA polymerase sigma-70 factor (ECF subfamily)
MSDPTLTVDLIRSAQEGDRGARDRLFARYLPRILKIVRMMMGQQLRDRLDSEDLTQETLLEAIRSFDGFEPRGEGSLLRWLKALARSAICAAADLRQAAKRRADRNVPIDAGASASGEPVLDPQADSTGPLDRLLQHEAADELEVCIARLSESDRDLILLHHYAEQSWAQIAEETGRPSADAARMAYVAAKARLASSLRTRGVED